MKKMIPYLFNALLNFGALGIYYVFPFFTFSYDEAIGFYFQDATFHLQVLTAMALIYFFAQNILIAKKGEQAKIIQFIQHIKEQQLTSEDWKNIRYAVVKFFFIPLMLPSALIYFDLLKQLWGTPQHFSDWIDYFNNYIFVYIVYFVSAVTLAFYAFGYLVESKYLNSEVKSVDKTVLGWGVLLICYVPFFVVVTRYIPFPTQDFTFFINREITFFVRLALASLLFSKMYVVSLLGAKCSNLTNRGIVTHGAYKYIRHPHYLVKLLIWWLTFIPFGIPHLWAFGAMFFWTVVYFLRAITEEKHLSHDEVYRTYKKKVKWMFIPYVL